MATAAVTNTFVNGQTADADDVNTNFTNLVSFLNASVVHADGAIAMSGDLNMGANGITNVASVEGHPEYSEFMPITGARFFMDPLNGTQGSSLYPYGISFMTVGPSQSGWPESGLGTVMTVRQGEGSGVRLIQFFFEKVLSGTPNSIQVRSRDNTDTAWGSWYKLSYSAA